MANKVAPADTQATLEALVEASGEGLVAFDSRGRIVSANRAAHELLGAAPGELLGATFDALNSPELEIRVRRALAGGPHATGKFGAAVAGRCLSGRTSRPRGGTPAAVLSLRDDTALAEERDANAAVLSATADGLIMLDAGDTVEYINDAALGLLSAHKRSVLGKKVDVEELLHYDASTRPASRPRACDEVRGCKQPDCPAYGQPGVRCWLMSGTTCGDGIGRSFAEKTRQCAECDYHAEYADAFDAVDGHEPIELELERNGQQVAVKVGVKAMVDSRGDYIGRAISLRDITSEREMVDMKNEFVSTVSHELRTPLTSIKGYVDLILDGSAGEINEMQQEFLGIVKENSDRLVELINEMLDISRIESGRVHLKIEPINMIEAIQGAVDTFRAVMSQTGRAVTVDYPADLPSVAADRDRVGQVLINLISNALKYSPGGGEVLVSANREGRFVRVSVQDHGLGISKDDMKRLFTKFYRVDSALTREIGGTGLGLSICKNIIELLGGEVAVKSRLGSGSTFSFTLPVAADYLVRTPSLEGPDQIEGKVLVVDRDPYVADLIETYLVKRGYEVVKAYNADEAFEVALRERPAAITLDVILEGTDGFDLLHRFKEEERTRDIPVVVVSIVCDEGRSCRLGAANYLEKPIDHNRLLEAIDELVGGETSPVVLVVDDDHATVKLLSDTLRKRGFAVLGAYDGAEAIAALVQRRPNVIVTDLKMPKVDGYELIETVKTIPEWADIPIILMTGYRIDPARIDVVEMATAKLNKPLVPEAIAEKVAAMIGRKGEVLS
jgi:signal transduction histidine kinase/DNA-binding response OmpR family regulator/PAS domain-containing protein